MGMAEARRKIEMNTRAGKYAGSEWVEQFLKIVKPEAKMSELGRSVADFLGELYSGIYHLEEKQLVKVEWGNPYVITILIGWKDWATVDFNTLSHLVFLAHHMALRVSLTPRANQYMLLMFHQRSRDGDFSKRCPSLDDAVAAFKMYVTLPEYSTRVVEGGDAGEAGGSC